MVEIPDDLFEHGGWVHDRGAYRPDRPSGYGFELVRLLGDLVTSEGTIYPLLSRLRRDGAVETTWRESSSGPPRRYYQLTDQGRNALDAFGVEWRRFRDGVDRLLAERIDP